MSMDIGVIDTHLRRMASWGYQRMHFGKRHLGFNCVCTNVVQRLTQLWSIQIQLVICFHVTLEPRMAFTFLNG